MEKNLKRLKENTGAIISTDLEGVAAYRARKKQFATFSELENRINNIETKLDQLLRAIDGITNTSNT